jgi:hypothetical protein
MKNLIVLFILLSFRALSFSQEPLVNQKIFDPKANQEILYGYCNRSALTDSVFVEYYRKEYDLYHPDKKVIDQIDALLDGIHITIVSGSWCEDSREQVPRFMKVVDVMSNSLPEPSFIFLDKDKKAGTISLEGLNVVKVPTFLVYRKDQELGRIIETPVRSLEEDFLEILRK